MSAKLPALTPPLLYASDHMPLVTKGEKRGAEVWRTYELSVKPNGSLAFRLTYSGPAQPRGVNLPQWRGLPLSSVRAEAS